MKKQPLIIIFLIVFCVLCFCGRSFSQANINYKRYQIESGIIEYTISGAQKGKEIVFFDQWGMREAKYTEIERPRLGTQHLLTLVDGLWVYTIDLDKKIGNKSEHAIIKGLLSRLSDNSQVDISLAIIKEMGGKKSGQGDVIDKNCDIWEIERLASTLWIWKGIPLQNQIQMPNTKIVISAKEIQEQVSIPESKFRVPANIHFIKGNIDEILLSYLVH